LKVPPTYDSISARARRLHGAATAAYVLACVGPISLVIRAMASQPHHIDPFAASLSWYAAGCSAFGALVGGWILLRNRKITVGSRRINHAVAALVIGVCSFAIAVGGFPIIDANANYGHPGRSCLSNIKQLALGVLMYSQDADDRLPLTQNWNDEIYPYTKNSLIFMCPSEDNKKEPSYGMNGALRGTILPAVAYPDLTVILFDSIHGKNRRGGRELLPDPPRHNNGHNVAFLDGHAKWKSQAEIARLAWFPKLLKPDVGHTSPR